MFSTGRLSSEVPYPFIYHLSRKRYPFRAESPRKGHYRESPGMGTHKHTRHSYVNSSIIKMQYFYNRLICKKAAFLQKYIFVKKELFYVKKQYFYNRFTCKKGLFYKHIFFFVKKQYFYNRLTCKKAVFLQPFNL